MASLHIWMLHEHVYGLHVFTKNDGVPRIVASTEVCDFLNLWYILINHEMYMIVSNKLYMWFLKNIPWREKFSWPIFNTQFIYIACYKSYGKIIHCKFDCTVWQTKVRHWNFQIFVVLYELIATSVLLSMKEVVVFFNVPLCYHSIVKLLNERNSWIFRS